MYIILVYKRLQLQQSALLWSEYKVFEEKTLVYN